MYIIILYCIPFVQGIFSVILVCKFKKYEFFKPPPNLIHAWIKTHMLRLWRLIVGSPHAGGIRVNVVGEHSDGLQSGDSHCVDEVGLVGFQEGPVSRQIHVQHILNSNVQVHVDYQTIFSLSLFQKYLQNFGKTTVLQYRRPKNSKYWDSNHYNMRQTCIYMYFYKFS